MPLPAPPYPRRYLELFAVECLQDRFRFYLIDRATNLVWVATVDFAYSSEGHSIWTP